MAKSGFWEDTFEKVSELGQSTAKSAVKATASIVNPTKIVESTLGTYSSQNKSIEQLEKGKGKKQNNTLLDYQKLQKKYEDQDMQKTNALRQRLFQMVKSEDEKSLMKKKQEEQEKKRKELYEQQERKKREEEKKKQEENQTAPQGKIRRSIFSHKKVAEREQTEVKPSSGKQ